MNAWVSGLNELLPPDTLYEWRVVGTPVVCVRACVIEAGHDMYAYCLHTHFDKQQTELFGPRSHMVFILQSTLNMNMSLLDIVAKRLNSYMDIKYAVVAIKIVIHDTVVTMWNNKKYAYGVLQTFRKRMNPNN